MKRCEVVGKIVGVRWVDVDKGHEIRSRLVAQEFASKDGDREDLFASTPPLASTRLIISDAASSPRSSKGYKKLMVLDIKRAFLYGNIEEELYIELPSEDPRSREGYVGKLVKAMYGTRAAPQVWQELAKSTMRRLGFRGSIVSPGIFFHPDRRLRLATHVEDFLCSGYQVDFDCFRK